MNKTKTTLIHPITSELAWKEKSYEGFVSREEFINRTGIFVTPSYFSDIYDYQWKVAQETGISIDEFINKYEENYVEEVKEVPLEGKLKYLITDDYMNCFEEYKDTLEPNLWEILNSLSREVVNVRESKQKIIDEYKEILKDAKRILSDTVQQIERNNIQINDLN